MRIAIAIFRANAWFYSALLLIIVVCLAGIAIADSYETVQAAPPADPEVVPCQEVNTAAVSDIMVIKVFRCNPENGAPYLLNSFGFMKDEE